MIRLIVADAGHTLGVFSPGTADRLAELSPLPKAVVAEESRRVLHRTPELTEEHITDLCASLLIDRALWPDAWPPGEFTAYPYASAVLDDLAAIAPIVVLSNIPVTSGPGRMADLQAQLPQVSRIYTSYGMRLRKPDFRLWQAIAADHGCSVGELVHLGDQFANDIRGAAFAGCRAVYVNTRQRPAPPPEQWPAGPDRIGAADDLRGVPPIITAWLANDAPHRH
ncbi:HAD family hydrolase [Amycolatopsis sp. NPDC004378]